MEHKTGCLICGDELVYNEKISENKCFYCGNTYNANEKCTNGHYICDNCHSSGALELIENYTISTNLTDPVEMAINLMKNPSVKMHGPEHHFLVPAVLLAAHYNTINEIDNKSVTIKTARKRGEKVPGGFCGFHGACGAGIGAGIFVSILTEATPVSGVNWGHSNMATAKALESIAFCGGPRCCKRDTFLSILTARDFVKETLDTNIEINPNIICDFSHLNKECIHGKCQFYFN